MRKTVNKKQAYTGYIRNALKAYWKKLQAVFQIDEHFYSQINIYTSKESTAYLNDRVRIVSVAAIIKRIRTYGTK